MTKRNKRVPVTPRSSKKYCAECKMKKRGANHEQGEQHKLKVKAQL